MKITTRQLRQLISESMAQNPRLTTRRRQQEAVYAIIYTVGYLDASDTGIGNILRDYPGLGEQVDKWVPLDEAFGNLNAVMIGGASEVKRKYPGVDVSEESSVLREGQAAGQSDFRGSVYRYIEQAAALVNIQTPIGMSASEALGIFGIEGGGVLFRDTAIADAQHLISLMNDDNVLSWLDELEGMKPMRPLVRESMDLASPMERMFLEELGATFYSEYDGARTGRGVFHEKFPNNCLVRFVLFTSSENTMFISDIETRGEDCQRKGYGRQVMETLVAKADMFDITLELDAAPYSDIPLDVLYQFYTSVGFESAAIGSHPYRMRRLPRSRALNELTVKTRGGTINFDPDSEFGRAIKFSTDNPLKHTSYYDKESNLVYHFRNGVAENQFDGIRCDDSNVTTVAKAKWKDAGKEGYFGDYPFLTGKPLKKKLKLTESKIIKIGRIQLERLIKESLRKYE